MTKAVVYDEEIYPNLFLIVLKEVENGEKKIFQISPYQNDTNELMKYMSMLKRNNAVMIGFNNLRFDYPILHLLFRLVTKRMSSKEIVKTLNLEALRLINAENSTIVRNMLIDQIDLYLINHYDNFAKSTSLKVLEFNLRMDNILTLPYFGKMLTKEQINEVIEYCCNDVEATYQFFLKNIEAIKFRKRFSKLYNHKFTNYNDVKIGEYILIDAIAKYTGKSIVEIKQLRTPRTEMKMSEIILPYIKFQSVELNTLLEWWRPKIITETKGQFTKLDIEDVKPLLPYCNQKTEKGKLKNLNIILNNFQFDFGTGGIHGDCGSKMFEANDEYTIYNVDVSSYYPNLASVNGFHPAHINAKIFKLIIDTLYKQRMDGKAVGDEQTVKAIKLALNGALYGKSNSPFSPMYDPQFMMSICVNGQLLLTMLAEDIIFEKMTVIQINTDGIFIYLKRDMIDKLNEIINKWMELTKLKLDKKEFKLMVQRDVNSYLAIEAGGKIKRKGAFDYNYEENGEYHKDFSMLVVPKALEAYYVHKIPVEQFIKNHSDLYDFFLRTKYDRTTKLVQRIYNNGEITFEERLQNITRYYVSNDDYTFVKIMPPLKNKDTQREFMVEAGYLCTEMNSINDEKMKVMKKSLNYDYYIEQVNKIIRRISYE